MVADEDDAADLGFGPFDDLEHHIDAVLRQAHQEGLHRRREPALAGVDAQQFLAVLLRHAGGEDGARPELQLLAQIVFLDVVVALEIDRVDQRVLAHVHDQAAALALQADVGEQAGGVERAQRAVHAVAAERVARLNQHVGEDGALLNSLVADDADGGDRVAGLALRLRWRGFTHPGRTMVDGAGRGGRGRVLRRCPIGLRGGAIGRGDLGEGRAGAGDGEADRGKQRRAGTLQQKTPKKRPEERQSNACRAVQRRRTWRGPPAARAAGYKRSSSLSMRGGRLLPSAIKAAGT